MLYLHACPKSWTAEQHMSSQSSHSQMPCICFTAKFSDLGWLSALTSQQQSCVGKTESMSGKPSQRQAPQLTCVALAELCTRPPAIWPFGGEPNLREAKRRRDSSRGWTTRIAPKGGFLEFCSREFIFTKLFLTVMDDRPYPSPAALAEAVLIFGSGWHLRDGDSKMM